MSEETLQQELARIEPVLKSDITWAIFEGPGWDPHQGAMVKYGKKVFEPNNDDCGVCAIGAHVIRNCQNLALANPHPLLIVQGDLIVKDVEAAAISLQMGLDDVRELYMAVTEEDSVQSKYQEDVWELSRRLRAHADAENARKAALSV